MAFLQLLKTVIRLYSVFANGNVFSRLFQLFQLNQATCMVQSMRNPYY